MKVARYRTRGVIAVALAMMLSIAGMAPAFAVESFDDTPAPQVTGKAAVGTWLKAEEPAWSPAASFTYEWRRDGKPIKGADRRVYKISKADLGHTLKVKVTGSAAGFKDAVRYSKDFGPVTLNSVKAASVRLGGSRLAGTQLKVKASGVWPADAKMTVEWFKGGEKIARYHAYRTTPADEGDTITAKVTFTKKGFAPYTVTRSAKVRAYPGMPDFTLEGKARVGKQVCRQPLYGHKLSPKVKTSTRFFVDGVRATEFPAACVAIRANMVGKRISAVTTAWVEGYPRAKYFVEMPSDVRKGFIRGCEPELRLGTQRSRLYVALCGGPRTGEYYHGVDYQWYRNGQPIPGATTYEYVPQSSDADKDLSVRVREYDKGYYDRVETVVWAQSQPSLKPVIAGAPVVGGKLVVSMPGWDLDKVDVTYTWLTNGETHGNGDSDWARVYQPTAANVGDKLMVVAEVKAPGQDTVYVQSEVVGPIRAY